MSVMSPKGMNADCVSKGLGRGGCIKNVVKSTRRNQIFYLQYFLIHFFCQSSNINNTLVGSRHLCSAQVVTRTRYP